MTTVKIIRVDPWHKVYGLLVPFLAHRVNETLQSMGDETSAWGPHFISRLWAKDPGCLLLAAVDPAGNVKGFMAAALDGGQVIILQPRLDEPTENDAVAEMMDVVENWAKENGVNKLTLISRKSDPKWLKKYGFSIERYVHTKELA